MKKEKFDVVVAGGGSAGVAAAIAASRTGAHVLLIERNHSFGGQATNSWVTSYCGFYSKGTNPQQIVFGVGEEVLEKIRSYGQTVEPTINPSTGNASIRFHPGIVKVALDDLLMASSVDFRLGTSVIGASRDKSGNICSITIQDDEETTIIGADAFIDATGNANLVHLAGIDTDWGDENGDVQQSSLACLVNQIPCREFPVEEMEAAIHQAKKAGIQGLNVDRGMIIKVPKDSYGYLTMPSLVPKNFGSRELTKNMMELHKKALAYTKALNTFDPDLKNMELIDTAPVIGYREGRRLMGVKRITFQDASECRKDPHTIGRAGWPIELHKGSGLSFQQIKENDWFDIPAEALISKDCSNLFAAGRLVSSDHIAMASLRVMGTAFASGQGAGILACEYAKHQSIDITTVQTILKEQNVLL